MRARDWATAAGLYERALAIRPDDAPLWVQLGHALKEQQQFEAAERAYRRATVAAPEDGDAALHLGHMLLAHGRRLAGFAALRHAAGRGHAEAARVADEVEAELGAGDIIEHRPATPAPMLQYAGRVLGLDGIHVVGWTVDTENPQRPVGVTLHAPDDAILAKVVTKPDAVVPSLAGAWRIPLPLAMLDGAPRALRVCFDGRIAPADGTVMVRMKVGGTCFVQEEGLAIGGWTEAGLPVEVSFDGGDPIMVPPLPALQGLEGFAARGFYLPVPDSLVDGCDHEAAVRLPADGEPLQGSPLRFRFNSGTPEHDQQMRQGIR